MTNMPDTRVLMLRARITMTHSGYLADAETVRQCYGVRHPAIDDGWWWMPATPTSAQRMARDGHKAVGSLVTTWYPQQTLGEILSHDEPAGEYLPTYAADDPMKMTGLMPPAWIPTPHATSPPVDVVGIAWKDEDEVDDIPIGPAWEKLADGELRPLSGWMSKGDARKIANDRGVPLEEV